MLGARPARIADVGLAHLHEPAAARQQPQRGVHELAGERVEDDVHALARRSPQEALPELQGARGGDVRVSSPSARRTVPLAGARGGEDLGAEVPGQLHGGHPDAAGAACTSTHSPARSGQIDQP